MGDQWPLTGRAEEVRRLRDSLVEASGALLIGPPGSGKSRLLTEARSLAVSAGFGAVTLTVGRATREIPLGAFGPLLPHDSVVDRPTAGLLRAVADQIETRAAGSRPAVFVDDAHHLDDLSALALVHAVRDKGAVVIAALDWNRPIPEGLATLHREDLLGVVEVKPLSLLTLSEALASHLGGPVDPAAALRVDTIAEGNLAVAGELIRAWVSGDWLTNDTGLWRLRGEPEIPAICHDIVDRELADLSAEQLHALEVIAFADPLGAAELDELLEPAIVADLERLGLVTVRHHQRRLEARPTRRLHAAVLRRRMPVLRRRELAGTLGKIVERVGARRQDDILRQASWQLDGDSNDPELLLEAAQAALSRHEPILAERLAVAAQQAGGGFDAHLFTAQLLEQQGDSRTADTQLQELAARATTDAERGRVAAARMTNLIYKLGDIPAGEQVADEALSTITDPRWRDEITALAAESVFQREGAQAVVELLTPLLARSSGRTFVTASLYLARSLERTGRLEAAIDIAARGHQAHQAMSEPLPFHLEVHLLYHCEALAHTGRFEAAAALAASGYHQALAANDAEAQALMALQRSRTAIGRGHLTSAIAHAREALGIFVALGCDRWAGGARIFLATAQALAGDAAAARAALNRTDEPELESMPFSSATDLKLAQAWTAVAAGQLAAGRDIAECAAVRAHEVGDAVGASQAWHTCARLGRPRPAAARLAGLAAVVEGDLITAQERHAHALSGRDAVGLEAVATSFAEMGAELMAAEAAADAAVCWRRDGDPRRATSAERLAGILAGRCPGARTPALAAVRARAALTPAEQDAAVLAAERRSNRYIAQALGLSVRTVENQLQRVYAKLGISHRDELARALREDLGVSERFER